MGVLKFLIITSIALFPLGEIIRIQLRESVFVKPIDITLGITFILWLALIVRNPAFAKATEGKKKIKSVLEKNYLIKPVLIFIVVSLVSLIINSSLLKGSEFFTSLLYLVRWAVYASVYFIVSAFDKAFKKTILTFMFIAGGIVLLGGFIQYAFYQNLRNLYYLGWDEHMHRLFSSFLDPNFAGAIFVLYLLFLAGIYIQRRNFIYIVLILFTLVSVYLTFSRSALLMLFSGAIVLFVMTKRVRLILILFIVSILFFVISSRSFNIENVNLLRTASSEARIESARDAISIIQENPLIGVGFNAYRYAQIRYGLREEVGAKLSHADAGTDNSFLFVLATTGIIGFASYLFIWYRILKNALSPVVIASIIGLFINSFFINSLFFPPLMLWIWMLVAVMDYK